MREPMNFANAIMIIAGIYLLVEATNGWLIAIGIILIIFGLATWGMWSNPLKDQEKRFLETKIKTEEARIMNLHAGTKQLLIQCKIFAQGIKPQ